MELSHRPILKRSKPSSIFSVTYDNDDSNILQELDPLDDSGTLPKTSSVTNLYNWDKWHPIETRENPTKPKKEPSMFNKFDPEQHIRSIKNRAYKSCVYTFLGHKYHQ
jgi:hypothetical protein